MTTHVFIGADPDQTLLTGEPGARMQDMAAHHFEALLAKFNVANETHLPLHNFPEETRLVAMMEMLNRNGKNIAFLRQILPLIINQDLSEQSDQAIYALRGQLTHGYMSRVNKDDLNTMAWSLVTQAVTDESIPQVSAADKLLTLALAVSRSTFAGADQVLAIRKPQDKLAFSGEVLPVILEQLADAGAVNADRFLPHTNQILHLSHDDLIAKVKDIAEVFATNKTLHERAAFSFFKSEGSDTIYAFVKELRALEKAALTPEQFKIQTLDVIQQFHDKIKSGRSIRTLNMLISQLEEKFPALDVGGQQQGIG